MFIDDSKQFSLPEAEKKVLDFWRANKVFEKSLNKNKKGKQFVFYEGPPSANGRPGMHHVLSRIFKDIVCRYRTMQGYFVPRKSGWDTHGLPVEIAVEKELGFRSKKEIEEYGIAKFNAKCREVVWQHKDEWEKFTERIGFWLDLEHPYITYENDYIESLWWAIKEIDKKKLLYQGHKIVPWCTRCGTGLSSHEVAQGYKEVVDNSLFVKFKLKSGQKIGSQLATDDKTYILSWTTTPWTLPGNVALAVGEAIVYSITEKDGDTLIVAEESPLGKELGHGAKKVKGKDLVGLGYDPLFNIPSLKNEASHKVYAADFVTTTDGTGVVHIAPMYGEDDYKLGIKVGLPQKHTVTERGEFADEVPVLKGLFVKHKDKPTEKETEDKIFNYLKKNKNYFAQKEYTHEYPHCWRCETPLLYYARTSWFISMTKVRQKLISENASINWIPGHLKKGRFGEWLKDVKDWNLSRERYWATPLPAWICEKCGEKEVIGSKKELGERAIQRNKFIFMRHGEATHVLDGTCGPNVDTKEYTSRLTQKGKEQVRKSGKILAKKKIDFIISSPLARAKETAEIVAEEIKAPIHYDAELIDLNPGIFLWKKVKKAHAIFKDEAEKFIKPYPEGESRNDVKRRMWQAIWRINQKYEGKTILIVGHADPLWMLGGALMGYSNDEILKSKYPQVGEVYDIPFKPLPLDDHGNLDFHRPYIDEIKITCKKCGGEAERAKEVIDVWFDSGAMPFAQSHYPFEAKEAIDKKKFYPADYISEAVDQTRGWFYTLLAVSTLLGKERPYKNVISLGHVNDKFGKKMSKSKGNVLDPWELAEKYGIDAVRWYLFTATPPGEPKLFDELEVQKTFRKFHMILWNSLVFYKTYAGDGKISLAGKKLTVLDKWVLARLSETIDAATKNLEKYDIRAAALAIENFTDDLSRWYIRRSRRRLQKPESKTDFEAASATLGFVIETVTRLMAPFTPFTAEVLRNTFKNKELSVHLADWPMVDKKFLNPQLVKEVEEVRRVASVALAKRAEAGIKVRQPLQTLRVKATGPSNELLHILRDEVNVKEVFFGAKINLRDGEDISLDLNITPELLEEGIVRELVRAIQDLRQDGGFTPKDKVVVMLALSGEVLSAAQKNEKLLLKEVNAKAIEFKKSAKFSAEIETKIGNESVWLGVRKV